MSQPNTDKDQPYPLNPDPKDDGLTPEEREQRERDRLTEGTQPEGIVDGTDEKPPVEG